MANASNLSRGFGTSIDGSCECDSNNIIATTSPAGSLPAGVTEQIFFNLRFDCVRCRICSSSAPFTLRYHQALTTWTRGSVGYSGIRPRSIMAGVPTGRGCEGCRKRKKKVSTKASRITRCLGVRRRYPVPPIALNDDKLSCVGDEPLLTCRT